MQVYGMELVQPIGKEADGSDKIVKVILVPWSSEEVKPKSLGLMDLAKGGTAAIFEEIVGKQQFKTEVYISMKEWLQEFKNQPFSHVKLNISLEKTAMEIVKGE